MTSLLAVAAMTASTLVPLPPLPPLPPLLPSPEPAPTAGAPVAVAVAGPDGRLRRGCHDYALTYAVTVPDDDWSLDLSTRDRDGRGVSAQSLLGPTDPESGTLPFRLCGRATSPGRFTVTGVLVSYDGAQETRATVVATFRLRRRAR
ncbi:hypothetical protein KDN32_12665 [Nocardioides sp. J2M5]|uniref:hypothetical protein n=1 Tax=Nocardioides palaemonis TaxID=2829810 RepID=UPI001BAC0AD1|nr:hypothetical protein [Nocardioides palaemonis]MBS2938593.1 hypothetical protein [Nocardioides palaemonis]